MPDLVCDVLTAHRSDETWLGSVLIATWALRTGRTLRRDVPCDALPTDELITFWADPLLDTPSSISAKAALTSRVGARSKP